MKVKLIKFFYFIFLLFHIPSIAFSGTFLIEPGFGYSYGKSKFTLSKEAQGFFSSLTGDSLKETSDATYNGLNIDLKIGLQTEYILLAIIRSYNPMYNSETKKWDTFENIGIGIGYEHNIPMRTFVGLAVFPYVEFSFFPNEKIALFYRYTAFNVTTYFGGYALATHTLGISIPMNVFYPDEWWRLRRKEK